MRYFTSCGSVLILCLFGCNSTVKNNATKKQADTLEKTQVAQQSVNTDSSYNKEDLAEIQDLVRHVVNWGESKNSFDLVPVITDPADTVCIGFDLEKVKSNLAVLKATGYFSAEFIDNYNRILQTLDKEMKDNKFSKWSTGDLPPFNFANDVDVWTDCQDVPYDTPNAYNLVEVHVVSLNKQEGELYWKWGKLKADTDPSWDKFSYKFKVKKEDGKWKIAYLEGFDYNDSIKVPV